MNNGVNMKKLYEEVEDGNLRELCNLVFSTFVTPC